MNEFNVIFASDFDGTLSVGGAVSERTGAAIAAFRERGGKFGVVTGRSVGGSEFLFDTVPGGLDFVLACNGAGLIRPDRTVEAFAEYPSAAFRELWEIALECGSRGLGPQSTGESEWIAADEADAREKLEAFIGRNERSMQCNMVFGGEVERAAKAAATVNDRCGGIVNALQNGGSVDIPARGVDKAFGVRRLAAMYGVAEDAIYAAGDQMNDFAMVSAFYGFAMAHAPDELRRAAKRTVSEVGEALEMIMKGDFNNGDQVR